MLLDSMPLSPPTCSSSLGTSKLRSLVGSPPRSVPVFPPLSSADQVFIHGQNIFRRCITILVVREVYDSPVSLEKNVKLEQLDQVNQKHYSIFFNNYFSIISLTF